MSWRRSCLASAALLGAVLAIAAPAAHPAAAGAELGRLVESYFDEMLELNPLLATFIGDSRNNDRLPNSIGPEHRAKIKALNERYLADARRLDPTALTPAERVTWDIFVRERERALQAERFPDHLLPSQPGREPADHLCGARLRPERAALRDRAGLRELAETCRRLRPSGSTRRS